MYENWASLYETFELKSLQKYIKSEFDHAVSMIPIFKEECKKYIALSRYADFKGLLD